MVLYLDIFFLENVLINYVILISTGLMNNFNMNKKNRLRIIFGSICGSLFAILLYLDTIKFINDKIFKFFGSIIIVYISFKPKNIGELIKKLFSFYLTSFIFGGCAFFLLYYINPSKDCIENSEYIGTYKIKIIILGTIISFLIVYIWGKINKNKYMKNNFCNIEIYLKNNKCKLKAFIDTGNFLKDPVTKKSVVIIEKNRLHELVSSKAFEDINRMFKGENVKISNEYLSKIKVLPYKSLGNDNGMLLGIKVDKIICYIEEKKYEILDGIIGIYDGTLTKNKTYSALVSQDMLEGVENECNR